MRQLLIAFVMLFALPSWAETRDPTNHFFQPKFGDFKAELDMAKQQGKKGIFLFFEMDDCPFCARMKSTILNQADVQDAYRTNFLVYTIDVNGDTQMTDFQGRETTEKVFAFENRVRATPTMLFFDLDGKMVTRFTGPARDKAEFLLLGKYVAEGAYAGQPFTKYKQGK
ncbi:MAG: thioredoxin [Thiobacillus sp. SCN 64-35]|jgi:thioredoxin-related protein|nr:thioredoxin fold domain-containing protein [Betaproteobacteria bacterium SCN1]MBN8760337.1 thioredoxin family protein [Thiobacillus sp.]ODU11256.1 MAG: thioredoxin [Thiobacillus sp. SCN 64-35]ODU90061.1 MAG: thioredoxin [Thiobacillus sp. SCN 65-179]OJW40030.1 MAG: thioredoxin [Thiobacillus sp. 65-69]